MTEIARKIVVFAKSGRDFLTATGLELIEKADQQELKDAAENPETMESLLKAANNSKDPYFKHKIFQALG